MIAAAVAQVVAGNTNNVQGEGISVPMNIVNNQLNQTHLTVNHLLPERRCSGTGANNSVCDIKSTYLKSDILTTNQERTPEIRSPSGSTLNLNQVNNGDKSKDSYKEQLATSRFISDGISQLTMGSFQVILEI